MSIKNNILVCAVAVYALGISSCKKYLDVNKNPNVATAAETNLLLPSTEIYIASALGVDLQVNGSIWAQYWTQNPNSSQYRQLEQYQPTSDDYNYPWSILYADAGEDLFQLEKIATDKKQKQYEAIALILKAYVFQVVTDGWGDAPFSEALMGGRDDGHITSPHYDMQKDIYTGLLKMLDNANELIDPSDPVRPGGDDLIFHGDMDMWLKFSNTLRLRILLRMSGKDPVTAQAGIVALYDSSPSFLNSGEDAQVNFSSASGNKNPLYAQMVGLQQTQNLVASKTCIDSMNSDNDYRILVFYESTSSGNFVGVKQGDFDAIVAPGSYSIPSPYVAGDALDDASALAPVKLITGYESLFLQAEAAVRYSVGGSAEDLFSQGIEASFNDYATAFADNGIPASDAYDIYVNGDTSAGAPPAYWSQFPTGGSMQDKIRHIITQKWFCMCGNQGFEAWTEWRRTGYPDFLVVSANTLIGNVFPRRFLYPNDEVTRNANFPGLKSVTEKVWWDIH